MSKTRVITGKVKLSYCHLFEPHAAQEGQEPKYGVQILIPKTDKATLQALKDAEQEALILGKDKKFGGRIPTNYAKKLRDGDNDPKLQEKYEMLQDKANAGDQNAKDRIVEMHELYDGHYFMSVNSKDRPQLINAKADGAITDSEELYSGCFGRVIVSAFAYNTNGNKGVTFFLNAVQKMADGERIGGSSRVDAFSAFGAVEDDEF